MLSKAYYFEEGFTLRVGLRIFLIEIATEDEEVFILLSKQESH